MSIRTDRREPDHGVIEAAAVWQAQLADEHCGEDDRRAFRQWLAADPAHGLAFDRMNAIAGRLSGQSRVERSALESMLDRRRHATALILFAFVGSAAMLGWWGSCTPAVRARIADERTAIGEQQRTMLDSGDRLTLDSATAVDIDDRERTVRLWQGGVMASVVRGRRQDFVVRTPQGVARALGTQYSVRIDGDATTVSVIESQVEACATAGNRSCLTLRAGQSARLDERGAQRIGDVDPAVAKAWSNGLLVADDRPLADVLQELNRYRADPIRYKGQDLTDLRVTGTLPLVDTDRALANIAAILPVTIERGSRGVSVRRR